MSENGLEPFEEIVWYCPTCRTPNVDIVEETSQPMCSACDEVFLWDEVAPEYLASHTPKA